MLDGEFEGWPFEKKKKKGNAGVDMENAGGQVEH